MTIILQGKRLYRYPSGAVARCMRDSEDYTEALEWAGEVPQANDRVRIGDRVLHVSYRVLTPNGAVTLVVQEYVETEEPKR